MVFLQNSALELCFHLVVYFSQQVSLYSSARSFHLQHFDSQSEEIQDKVSVMNRSLLVDCRKRFPVSQTNFMYQIAGFSRGSKKIEDVEKLLVDWERGIILHCKWVLYLGILLNHSYNSFFPATPVSVKWALFRSVAFSQFISGEFVNSHFLGSLQIYHFMNTSDLSFSKYSFSLSLFFMKSGLLFSRFFIALIRTIDFQMIGIKLSLKITNRTVEKICAAFLLSLIRFRKGCRNALSRIVIRSYTRSVEEQRLDTQIILFRKIFGLITCRWWDIGHIADTHLLWIVAGIDLARMESRGRLR